MMDVEKRLERIEKKLGIQNRGETVWWCDIGNQRIKFYKMTKDEMYISTEIYDKAGHPLIAIVEDKDD